MSKFKVEVEFAEDTDANSYKDLLWYILYNELSKIEESHGRKIFFNVSVEEDND